MQRQQAGPDGKCEDCFKKNQLIEKYLGLIDLLKKKSDKSNVSMFKKSIDVGLTSALLPHHTLNLRAALLPFVLQNLSLKRQCNAFGAIMRIHTQKKCSKGYMFLQTIQRLIQRRMLLAGYNLFSENNAKIHTPNHLEKQAKILLFDRSAYVQNSYNSVSLFMQGEKRQKLRQMPRKIFQLTQQLARLNAQKQILEERIEENYRRQEVESKKKKESLEMLAQEMAQKNETIAELQASLKFYEDKHCNFGNNVLEEDTLAMKREIEKLEKVNQKLNFQLEKKSEAVQKNTEMLRKCQERLSKVQSEHVELKQRNFEMGVELQDLERRKRQYNGLSIFLEKKIKNLKKYQRLITNNLKAIDQCSLSDASGLNASLRHRASRANLEDPNDQNLEEKENNFRDCLPISKFQSQYKIEKILNFLYNIELEDVLLNNDEQLFDNEELAVLNEVKSKFHQLNDQFKNNKIVKADPIVMANNSPVRLSNHPCNESDEVYFNEQQVSGSIFEVFATEKGVKEQNVAQPPVKEFEAHCSRCNGNGGQDASGGTSSRRKDNGFTIRLLQLEIEKNKQVEKISELKNKLFHIRSIVMNLIKSLELKSLRPETRDIVDLCFEFFEYSEEEKETIFHTVQRREKRFLGLF